MSKPDFKFGPEYRLGISLLGWVLAGFLVPVQAQDFVLQ